METNLRVQARIIGRLRRDSMVIYEILSLGRGKTQSPVCGPALPCTHISVLNTEAGVDTHPDHAATELARWCE
jgi:hypothetical protein